MIEMQSLLAVQQQLTSRWLLSPQIVEGCDQRLLVELRLRVQLRLQSQHPWVVGRRIKME
jgi:hypothetical protein